MKLVNAIILLGLTCVVESARILGIFYFPSKSHHILGEGLFKALAKRGHQVTMVSPYTIGKPVENYNEIVIDELLEYKELYMQDIIKPDDTNALVRMYHIFQQVNNVSQVFWESKPMQALLKSDNKYDLVIAISAMHACVLGLSHKFDAPLVMVSTVGSNTFTNLLTGNPTPYSYVPVFMNNFDERRFLDRLLNTIAGTTWELVGRLMTYKENKMLQRYIPNAPSIEELLTRVDLVLLNSHYSTESIRPYLPNMVPVGGYHINEPQALPKDIQAFLDGAKDGAVFFSLGSNVKLSKLPEGKKGVIIKSLGKLKEKVLLKSDENLENLPKNIKVGKWFPQNDILAHPNIRAFISHGGLLSTLEAVYHGVPIVGLPCFADQEANMLATEKSGYAIKLDILSIEEESFYKAIREVIDNKKYKENIQKRSALLRERPMKPMDTAVFWIEHVIKHKGADHLRSPRLNLYWYQYLLLDVVACITAALIFVLLIGYFITKKLIKCLFGRKDEKKVKEKRY